MQTLRRVGMDTAHMTDEELMYVDNRIVDTVRPLLIGRRLFPVFTLPHAGFLTVRGYKRTDMSQARISLHGQGKSKDRSEKTPFDITVPVIHKEFTIYWREIEASRANGVPIDLQDAENAARQCAEEEDKLLLTGEYTGWRALGVEGLATATGRNTKASAGAWPANCLTDLSACIGELEADGHMGPYAAVLRSTWAAFCRFIPLRELLRVYFWDAAANWETKCVELIAGIRQAGYPNFQDFRIRPSPTVEARILDECLKNFGRVQFRNIYESPLNELLDLTQILR